MQDKYLKVTIYDNDFTSTLEMVCETLYEIFQQEGKYPTEEDFPTLQMIIQHMWFATDMAQDLMRWGHLNSPTMKYFIPDLSFVTAEELSEWENHEVVYIPMFDDYKILMR